MLCVCVRVTRVCMYVRDTACGCGVVHSCDPTHTCVSHACPRGAVGQLWGAVGLYGTLWDDVGQYGAAMWQLWGTMGQL